ncbi:uncharacterized protein N7511_011099 [Penicillium nucicola]|uniref:uncharacterized protein n=1 Tax=Penicillium nucicola TaxID=1850975 RepID=UPI0025453AB6|nr:uncharacterized protein N7511_011099 [Penicillium nucicola]KAJ5742698.1 hypothetical protein N7511_011099 [Penicillium nucicola]
MDQFERLRPVGRLEQYSTARHQVGFYLNVAVSATYSLPDSFTSPIKDYVYQACEAAITEHPSLSAIVADDHTQDPYFVRLPQIDLDHVVSFQDRQLGLLGTDANGEPTPDLDLQALLATQHNLPFEAPNPLWRLCILQDTENQQHFTAAFVYHHAIGDGTSGKAFHQTLLRALSTVPSGDPKTVILPPQSPLLPSIETIHSMNLSMWYLTKKLFQAKIYSRRDEALWTGAKIRKPTQTRLRLVPFSESIVTVLRDFCRQENTTITAFLQTLVARSLFAHLPVESSKLNCSGALSCRRWLLNSITDDCMGVWVQDYEEQYTRDATISSSDNTFPWAEARRSRKTISSVLKMKGKDASINLLQFVDNFQQELCLSRIGLERDKSFEVSNLGVVPTQTDPDIPAIRGMVFSQCASVMGNALQVSVVTGGDGCLVLAVSWQEGVVEVDLVNAFIESIRDEIYHLTGRS